MLYGAIFTPKSSPFASPQATTNSSAVAADANNYPDIRIFTVGQGTSSKTPLSDLATIEQQWSVANQTTVSGGGGFGHFSSVCWFFGKQVHDGLGGGVPLGLISKCVLVSPTASPGTGRAGPRYR